MKNHNRLFNSIHAFSLVLVGKESQTDKVTLPVSGKASQMDTKGTEQGHKVVTNENEWFWAVRRSIGAERCKECMCAELHRV